MRVREETTTQTFQRPWVFWAGTAIVVALLGYSIIGRMSRSGEGVELPAFAQQVDLSPLDIVAVQSQGRVKSFRSFSTDLVSFIAGNRVSDPGFLYFDLLFRPEAYDSAFVIFVKSKPIRRRLFAALEKDGFDAESLERFANSGYLPPVLLERGPAVREVLDRLESDTIGAAKHVQAIQSALELRKPQRLAQNLLMLRTRAARHPRSPGSCVLQPSARATPERTQHHPRTPMGESTIATVICRADSC